MHWLQRKRPQLSARSHFFKNQEKLQKKWSFLKNGLFWKMVIFDSFSWFFPEWNFAEIRGFLRCSQCIKTLHLSYQTPPYDDFQFLGYNGFLQFFTPLVAVVKHQILISIFLAFLWHKAYKITPAGNLSLILREMWQKGPPLVNCVWNCVMPLFTPLRSSFQKIFFSKTYSSLIWNARLALKVTFEPYWWEESGIFLIRGLKSHNFA